MPSRSTPVQVVIDIESSPPMPVGRFLRQEEDTIIYDKPEGTQGFAPADCVVVLSVPLWIEVRTQKEERQNMIDAHAEGLHDEIPREFCPECER
jgi:hypothetical protein